MSDQIFISKPANKWIKKASLKPIPKMLFSEFWFKRDFNKPISNNDLQGSKMLINLCDSAFAIGLSYSDSSL